MMRYQAQFSASHCVTCTNIGIMHISAWAGYDARSAGVRRRTKRGLRNQLVGLPFRAAPAAPAHLKSLWKNLGSVRPLGGRCRVRLKPDTTRGDFYTL